MLNPRWFGGRLRELRAAAEMTQVALAEATGLTPDTLVKIEAGNRLPRWDTVVALCFALRVMPNAFLKPPSSDQPAPKRGRPPMPRSVG